jgi:hypothetical protein
MYLYASLNDWVNLQTACSLQLPVLTLRRVGVTKEASNAACIVIPMAATLRSKSTFEPKGKITFVMVFCSITNCYGDRPPELVGAKHKTKKKQVIRNFPDIPNISKFAPEVWRFD